MTVLAPIPNPSLNLLRFWRSAEKELNERLVDILNRGPEWYREEARLRALLGEVRSRMSELASAISGEVDDVILATYAQGAVDVSSVVGQAFEWAQPHLGAASIIANDTYADLLTATQYVPDTMKQVIRQAAKIRASIKTGGGQTARQAGRALARTLYESGIANVVYRDGRFVRISTYSEMVMRTKTAMAYNMGTLNHATTAGVKWFELVDGPDCGLTYHDDPTLADGLIVDATSAAAYPIAHPNCRRVVAPRPDLPDVGPKSGKSSAKPVGKAAQKNAKAFEKYLKDSKLAAKPRQRPTREPRAARTPRTPRVPAPAPVVAVAPVVELPVPRPADLTQRPDIESMSYGAGVLSEQVFTEAERLGFDMTSFDDWKIRGAMKEYHQERIARDIAGRLDEFPALKTHVEHRLAQMDVHERNVMRAETIARRQRADLSPNQRAYITGGTTALNDAGLTAIGRRAVGQPVYLDELTPDELLKLGFPGDAEALIEENFAEITDQWAGSSGDSDARSVALQVVAAERLNLSTDTMWRGLDALHDAISTGTTAVFRLDVQRLLDSPHRLFLEAYVDSVYRATQAHLAASGVTEVVLQRGMKFGGVRNPSVPTALSDLAVGQSKVVSGLGNPLQSWSTDTTTAKSFAFSPFQEATQTLFTARVPARYVFSMPSTGPGCLNEYEWVLLGMDNTLMTVERIGR